VVGVPIGTVMSRLARGRERLARRLRAPDTRKLP
jgi:DNA-directed RNA polymerase specialized sigma24 family protein